MSGLITDRRGAARAVRSGVSGEGVGAEAVTVMLAPFVHAPDPQTLAPLVRAAHAAALHQAGADLAAKADTIDPGEYGDALEALLDEAGVTIQSVAGNRIAEVGRQVAQSINDGTTVEDLTGILADVLDDPEWAGTVAVTETTRAMATTALAVYANGDGWVSILSAEDTSVCTLCNENEEAGVLSVWELPPNGWPPTHPNCRCAVVPAAGPAG